MTESFLLELDHIQPSQLFVSSAKLARVQASFDPACTESLAPVPVKELDGRLIYTDGHTRALAAFLAGLSAVPAVWDEDELDWHAYRICVAWCRAAGIKTVADLEGRVVPPYEYEVLWLRRCRDMQQALAGSSVK